MLSFIVITHDRLAQTRILVESIHRNAGGDDYEILFVDDGSDGATLDYLAGVPRGRVVPFPQGDDAFNYHRARNAGVPHATGDLLCFVNNDVEFLTPDMVSRVAHVLGRNPAIGILSPVEVPLDPEHPDRVVPSPELSLPRSHVVWPWGGCAFMRRETWDAMGGFDESYTGYQYEEAEQGMSMLRLGLRVALGALAVAHHHEPQDPNPVRRTRQGMAENCRRFAEKYGLPLPLIPITRTCSR